LIGPPIRHPPAGGIGGTTGLPLPSGGRQDSPGNAGPVHCPIV
jgi:hypothetical protein